MNKKDLIDLGIAEDVAEKVVVLHAKDIESHKTKITELQGQADTATAQLTEANKQIESFKNMKPEELQKAADEWKTKFEQAQEESKNTLAQVKFDHALDSALATAKAKNPKAVKALLDMDVLKKAYDEKSGAIVNFDEHLKPVREQNDYLFEGDKPTPKIITGGNNKPVGEVPGLAAWKAAGFKEGPPEK
jgi:hypothetical protein